MKTKEELNVLKEKAETVSKKLHELTDEDLEKVTGGKNEVTPETENTEVEFSVQFDDPVK